MIRQGDLLFVSIEEIEASATEDTSGILARGEATGHTHMIRPGQRAAMMVAAGIVYINAMQECAVDHQEHKTVMLPSGKWRVNRQREYIPDGWRQVAD